LQTLHFHYALRQEGEEAGPVKTAAELILELKLEPHPEGGFFRETYRSKHSTAIFFLLPRGHASKFHRLKSDEVWHVYGGGPLHVVELVDGKVQDILLSADRPQHVVPGGTWFGSYPDPSADYALVGCTVAPAFEFKDFEMAKRESLLEEFPLAKSMIERLT
jgi:predicted cupin superfamily sugar epimerase